MLRSHILVYHPRHHCSQLSVLQAHRADLCEVTAHISGALNMSPFPPFSYPLADPTPDQVKSNASKTILLTGVNGYIASHIALLLLQHGYTVLGTSRNASTLDNLLKQPAFAPFKDTGRLKHTVIKDITTLAAFEGPISDPSVYGVIHTASPVDFRLKTVDAFYVPAVGGVGSIATSILEENKQRSADNKNAIRSLILLSSIAAVVDKWKYPPISDGGPNNRDYTEDDWNVTGYSVARESEVAAKEGTGKFLPMVAYGASKASAERSMWELVKQHFVADNMLIDLASSSICPGVCMGPPVNWPSEPDGLNETLKPVWDLYTGACKERGALPPQIGGATYVDVRDVAALHVWCLENPEEAKGQRYLATNGKANPQAFADCLRDVIFKDDEKVRSRIGDWDVGKGYVMREKDGSEFDYGWPGDEPTVKATKAYKALGIEGQRFRGLEEILRDTVEAFREQWPGI